MKNNKRQDLINKIIETKYKDDDDKFYDSNIAFLESLSLAELESLAESSCD